MSYKEQLRAAHIASLKQKYLDAIAKSRASEEQNNAEHQEQSRELYISRKTAERDLPQQLRAKGLGGGAQAEDIASVLEEYRAKYDELKREQSEFSKKIADEIAKQQNLMELALREYSLKNALADENDAASSKKSGSSSRAGSKSSSKSGSGTAERGTLTSQTISGGITTRAKKYRGANGGGTGGGVR